ncbi:hypothetical protein B9Y74_21440 [Stenotrophomonas maltophilia]|nr:hypothetical protein B9Y74_21440 [Stenotrophomonas maltophilia]
MAISGQNDDGWPALAGGVVACAVGAGSRPVCFHADGTLGLEAEPQSRPDGPCRAYAGLTTGNRYRFTMHRRRTPCIIRAHLSIRIKGYYA